MAASSVTGIGQGSVEKTGKKKFLTANEPHIIIAGDCNTDIDIGNGNWQALVTFPELPEGPEAYSVFVMQSDYGNNDGRNNYPAHIEKIDADGNNEDDGFVSGMGGFKLHTGDSSERRFMYMVVKNGRSLNK